MTLIDKAEALLPCPFCGGEAELWNAHDNRPAWIACMGRCAVLISKEHATDAEAIAAWNRRAIPARGVGVPLKQIGTGLYEQPAPNPAAIREAWEKAYWRMRSYAVHDNDCKLNKPPHFDGPCSCGLTAALEDALALIQMEEQK